MAVPVLESQLEIYSKTYGVYDHILSLQKILLNLSQIFVLITGVLWGVIVSDRFALDDKAQIMVLGFHILVSGWVFLILIEITGSIRLRFFFLKEIGERLFPTLWELGGQSFTKANRMFGVLPIPRAIASWAHGVRWVWLFVPLLGVAGSGFLIYDLLILHLVLQ